MSCELIQEKTADEVAGRADPATAAMVRDHVRSCAACAAFRESALALYALDFGDRPVEVPAARLMVLPDRAPSPYRRVAAAALVLLIGIGIGFFAAGGFRRLERNAVPVDAAVAPDPVTIALPPFPANYESAEWTKSAAEAATIGRFTGRPILTVYTFAECPRCQAMERYFNDPKTIAKLSRFVLLRVDVRDELPRELARAPTPMSPFLMMPALVLSTEDMTTAPAFEIDGDEMVESFVKNWDAAASGRRPPLPPDEFSDAAEFFGELPDLLSRFRYGAIYRELDVVARLDERFTTAFAALARDVRTALDGAVGRQIERLLRDGADPAQALVAKKKAAALAQALESRDLARRLDPLLH